MDDAIEERLAVRELYFVGCDLGKPARLTAATDVYHAEIQPAIPIGIK